MLSVEEMLDVDDLIEVKDPDISSEEPVVDGRTMRRTRNRKSVINALLSMIREGDLRPAAAEIADRAGVSHRSIFRYFDDLDDLVHTTITQAVREVGDLSAIPDIGEGKKSERISTYVDARLSLLEFIDRPMQVARARANSIPSIDLQLSSLADFLRTQISEHFAPELSKLDDGKRCAVIDTIVVLTSYDVYYTHVRILGDDIAKVRATWNLSLASLLRN